MVTQVMKKNRAYIFLILLLVSPLLHQRPKKEHARGDTMPSTTRMTRSVPPLQRMGLLLAMITCGLLCLVVLSGCGSEGDGDMVPSTSPSPVSQSVAMGIYRGMTSQDLPIEIHVGANNIIERLVLRIRMSLGTGTCTIDFTPTAEAESITITNGQFQATVSPPRSQGISSTINGSFHGTAVSGSYKGFSGEFSLVCGLHLITGTAGLLFSDGTFTAVL